ncbi:hypothetical protein SCLCIDRAFT_33278 [Scleroderma citrinum Foug A]|uniref:Integrase catalytic domain-containing protein n=1 Tax=Scleroderma citrinum Foug A TaxID=1036808 RepID=A0A0C2YPM2_9AGAM|nr:hypothetical protein SCLCIDRAFT_33278 [Scleroderma citrinum Foug A]
MDPEKVNAILKWPELMNVKQVHAFLRLGNFYRCFIKDYAIISRPMADLTCKDVIFNFGDKEKASFEALKAAFTTAPVLQYPDQDCKFCLKTNVSEFAVGGVISVKCDDGEFRPVAYMSHSMTPPEQNYPIHNKEMLAIIKATEAWRHYLKATPYAFEIHMDHNNLLYFTKSQNLSKRQARWQQWMMRFSYQLIYKKGSQMHIADPLSRRSDHYVSSGDDNKDQVLLNPVTIKSINVTDCTYEECQSLIMDFHDTPVTGHKGVKATYNGLRKHYVWNGMKEQIQTYVKHCQKTSGSLIPLPTPSGPWQDITMDFTEMLESLGYNYILVVVDQFSKEVVFVPCTKEETTYSTAELFRDHVWCQHGLPSTIVSDHGSVFASNFLGELYKLLGIKRKMSTAFHPQTDGQTEQLNCEINQYLRTYINDQQNKWAKWIKIAQFVWNNTVSEVTTDSPFGITQSYSPRMGMEPAETTAPVAKDFAVIFNKVVEASEKAKLSMKVQADKHQNPAPDYKVGQQVWLSMDNLHMLNHASKKLTEKWIGPYETLRIHLVVNVSRVKPYLGPLPSQPMSQPGPIQVSKERDEEYEVNYIVASCIYRCQLQYLVHWKGYEEHECTWEPASHVKNAPLVVERFYKENPSAPRKLCMAQSDFDSLFKPTPKNLTICEAQFCSLESCS